MKTIHAELFAHHDSLRRIVGDPIGSADDESPWQSLAGGNPFRCPSWMAAWWRHLAPPTSQALILSATDADNRLIGLLPLYRTTSSSRVWRSWGDGNTCTDHSSLICDPSQIDLIAPPLAAELVRICRDPQLRWDRLEIDGVLAGDAGVAALSDHLAIRGSTIDSQSRMNLWFKPCGDDWESFLGQQSKKLRGKLRQLLRLFDDDDAFHVDESGQDLPSVHGDLDQLIQLHQERWRAIGQPGTFGDVRMIDFLHEVMESLVPMGRVYLPILRHRGQAVASELHLIGGDGRLHCYTSGTDLTRNELMPGLILNAHTLRHAHTLGVSGVDYMRGDETYKQRLSAESIPLLQMQVFAPTMRGRAYARVAKTKQRLWQTVRRWRGKPTVQTPTLDEAFSIDARQSPCHSPFPRGTSQVRLLAHTSRSPQFPAAPVTLV